MPNVMPKLLFNAHSPVSLTAGSTCTSQDHHPGNASMSSVPCHTSVSCCAHMPACLQVESAVDHITSTPNSNSSQQHVIRGKQGAAASQAASWAPPNSANAAAPSAAMLSSVQQPTMSRPAAIPTSQPTPTMHSRPSAPYLSRPTGLQASRHRPHPVSAAAAAAADKRQLAQEARLNVQQSSRLRQVADSSAAAEAGERLLTHQSVARHWEPLAACGVRRHAAASGVIDLTADGCADSPSTSASSDCMILGASTAAQNLTASASPSSMQGWAQAGPSCVTEEPVELSRGAHAIRSAEAEVAELWQSSNAATQLPQCCDRLVDLSSGSASATAAAEPWQNTDLASKAPRESGRSFDVRGVSARQGGPTLAPPRDPSAQLTAGAPAACSRGKRSRWDIMPEGMSADITPAQQPPATEAPLDLPAHIHDTNAAVRARAETTAMSVSELYQAKRQPLHCRQPTDYPEEVSAGSRLERSEATTQEDVQRACRSPHRAQQLKQSRAGRKHIRHSRHRSSSRSSHRKRSICCRSSHHSQRNHKHSRRRCSGSPDAVVVADGHYISGSNSGHTRHVLDTPDMLYAQLHPQRQITSGDDERLHAATCREASQGDRWPMWQP